MLLILRSVRDYSLLPRLEELGEVEGQDGNFSYLVGQRHDDLSEVAEGAVDVLRLFKPHASCTRLLQPFAAGQINLVKSF